MYPFIHIFGKTIGTYGLCMAVALVLVCLLSIFRGKRCGLVPEDVLIVGVSAVGAGLLFGSLLYILVTYSLAEIFLQIQRGSFEFLNGGIVFYGGLIGGILGALFGIKLCKCKFRQIEYAVVPYIPLGHAIGRVGCVLAGCCHGFAYDGPFALYYPNAVSGLPANQGYFPVQPLESLLNLILCILLLFCSGHMRRKYDVLMTYLGCYGVIRFILELFRGDSVRGIYFALSISQWISIGMVLVAGCWFCFTVIKNKRHR